MEIEQPKSLDENLYSRQIGTFGMETMTKLVKMRVLILGMKGLGVETAKNLIMAGPKSVTIWDPETCSENDRGTNFFINQNHIQEKASRANACLKQLSQLNPYVKVANSLTADLKEFTNWENLQNFDIVVATNTFDYFVLKEINNLCKANNRGFIYAACKGLLGFTFVDFGTEHVIYDKNGEQCKSVLISSITKDGIVTTQEDKRHDLEDGDIVKFKEIVGLESLNGRELKVDKVLTPYTMQLEDLGSIIKEGENYVRNGILEEVKARIIPEYKTIDESLEFFDTKEFELEPDMDFMKPWRLIQIKHVLANALRNKDKYLPEGLDFQARKVAENVEQLRKDLEPEAVEEDNKIVEESNEEKILEEPTPEIKIEEEQISEEKTEEKVEEQSIVEEKTELKVEEENIEDETPEWKKKLDTDLIKYCLAFWNLEVSPMTAFWGGIVAQEVVKYTGKFTPIHQWLIHEFYSSVFKHKEMDQVLLNLKEEASGRYRDQVLLFGKDVQNKIEKTKLFMIGAGALGCEYLKLFALMGIGAGEEGLVSVTDDDTIEISNLNRQFLFRKSHVGQSKAVTAIDQAKKMNPSLKSKAFELRVDTASESIFTDDYYNNLTYIVNAVDNIKARMYVDAKAVLHRKWLFEAGTLGTKCNSQIIRPDKTESYSDSTDPEEKHIPMCTLRNFPFLIEHCIEWSRDKFFSAFSTASKELKKIQDNRENYFVELSTEAKFDGASVVEKLQGVKSLLELAQNPSFEQMVLFARQEFQVHYFDGISKLLKLFPRDYVDKEGVIFWKSPKRAPTAIKFDTSNEKHLAFLRSVVLILSDIFAGTSKLNISDSELIKAANNYSQQETKIVDEEEERKAALNKNSNENSSNESLADRIKELATITASVDPELKVEEIEFEKDDDSNGHIDFITLSSNFRAENYELEQAPRHKIKMIAGKIIPAIATTTAMVVGAMGIEFYKFYLESPTPNLRNFFSNLGISMINFSEPMPPVITRDKEYDPIVLGPIKAMPPKWHTWSRIEVKGKNMKIKDLRDIVDKRLDITLEGLSLGKLLVWNSFGQLPDFSERVIEEVFDKEIAKVYPGKKYYAFTGSAVDKEMVDLSLPYILYISEN